MARLPVAAWAANRVTLQIAAKVSPKWAILCHICCETGIGPSTHINQSALSTRCAASIRDHVSSPKVFSSSFLHFFLHTVESPWEVKMTIGQPERYGLVLPSADSREFFQEQVGSLFNNILASKMANQLQVSIFWHLLQNRDRSIGNIVCPTIDLPPILMCSYPKQCCLVSVYGFSSPSLACRCKSCFHL